MTRVLVCGGRDFDNEAALFEHLDELHREHDFAVVIEGEARGADQLAAKWARSRGIEVIPEPVTKDDYDTFGRYEAPRVRNRRMVDDHKPDIVVAFPGSGGTGHMVRYAITNGIPVIEGAA